MRSIFVSFTLGILEPVWGRHIWLVKLSLVFTWGILDWNWGRPPESIRRSLSSLSAECLRAARGGPICPVQGRSRMCLVSIQWKLEQWNVSLGGRFTWAGRNFPVGGKWSFARLLHPVVGCSYIIFLTQALPSHRMMAIRLTLLHGPRLLETIEFMVGPPINSIDWDHGPKTGTMK